MAKKEIKKESIRKEIIDAAKIYSNDLAGKVFLYVFGDEFFEVLFSTKRFVHLTGVDTNLGANDFYKKSKSSILTTSQFHFSTRHPFDVAKKKLPCLLKLPELTRNLVCVVKDMSTVTLTYKMGITNLDFTLGLTENVDEYNNKINNWWVPRTLRVKDKPIENSTYGEFVDFIFVKSATASKYEEVLYANEEVEIPDSVKSLLHRDLLK